ncbi:SRPBCC family protein [Streptomyces sp. NBC_00670]|jgi:hypothetical protein|uniref:SRPBCC family protein n=1 Tax=Streptomyces sp. NBC_00670 TaxID=2975804 RepID=UPI002E340BFE|nr:SRPBCC family protein [Streptomyces sp. NBC_00670]
MSTHTAPPPSASAPPGGAEGAAPAAHLDAPAAHLDPAGFAFARSAWLPVSPERVYDLVSEVSHIGLWSPNASRVRYDDGAGPRPGAWFGGHNRGGGREWDSRSQVLTARPGAEFAYVVGGTADGIVRWRWTMRADGPGSLVTQHWQLLRMDPVLGATRREVEALRDAMAASAETTLTALAKWLHTTPHTTSRTTTGAGTTTDGKDAADVTDVIA